MQSGGTDHIYQCYQLKKIEMCIMLHSVCAWFGNLSVDKLYNRIVKTRPLEKLKIKEFNLSSNIQEAM